MVDQGEDIGGFSLTNLYYSENETFHLHSYVGGGSMNLIFPLNRNPITLEPTNPTFMPNAISLEPTNQTIIPNNPRTLHHVQESPCFDGLVSDVSNIRYSSSSRFSWPNKAKINFSLGLLSDVNVNHASFSEKGNNVGNLQEGLGLPSKNMKYQERSVTKRHWTDKEDRKLRKLVNVYGEKQWADISEKIIGRDRKQCRHRWFNHLRPHIKKGAWSEEEEMLLVEAHRKMGNKWADIARTIPGRTENAVKNHFWNTFKKMLDSRTVSQSTILEDYIKTYHAKKSTNIASLPSIVNVATSTENYDDDNDLMSFMQGFLGNNNNLDSSSGVDNVMVCEEGSTVHIDGNGLNDHGALNFIGSTHQERNEGYICENVMEGFTIFDESFPESNFVTYTPQEGNVIPTSPNSFLDYMFDGGVDSIPYMY